jgi:DNA-binding NtrC family response regulator
MMPRTILVVEDEYFLADDCASLVKRAGFDVAGPYGSIEEDLDLKEIAGAVIDINLRGTGVFPLLDRLLEMNIPVVVYTGYNELPEKYAMVPRVIKPTHCSEAVKALCRQFENLDQRPE